MRKKTTLNGHNHKEPISPFRDAADKSCHPRIGNFPIKIIGTSQGRQDTEPKAYAPLAQKTQSTTKTERIQIFFFVACQPAARSGGVLLWSHSCPAFQDPAHLRDPRAGDSAHKRDSESGTNNGFSSVSLVFPPKQRPLVRRNRASRQAEPSSGLFAPFAA
ncbi:MAG: hypothetical protein HW389_3172 [Bacteroidetes bacterium]|nr:hypothetical protein [Bacteroidota bacterium]